MLEALEHLQLVKNHALIAPDVFLQDDLDGDPSICAVGLPDDTVGACAQRAPEAIFRPISSVSVLPAASNGRNGGIMRTSCRSSRAARAGD